MQLDIKTCMKLAVSALDHVACGDIVRGGIRLAQHDAAGFDGGVTRWGEALRALRLRSNMKQEDAASRLQVSQSYISRLENGVITPSPEIAARLRELICNPAHRPLADQLKAVVRHSPHAVALLACRGEEVVVEEASARFRSNSPPIRHLHKEMCATDPLGKRMGELACTLVRTGAFEGKVACVEFAWRAEVADRLRNLLSIQTPVYAGTEWLVHSATVQISSAAYDSFTQRHQGTMRVHQF